MSDTKRHPQDVGSVLHGGGKPYFPMLLGNGEEHVLIGYSGGMGACAAHEHWNFGNSTGAESARATETGWFRLDPRPSQHGWAVNMLQCSYIVCHGVHATGVDYAEQQFDAATGILESRCRLAGATATVKTFLTRDHQLVHRLAIEPKTDDMSVQFFLKQPRTGIFEITPQPMSEGTLPFTLNCDEIDPIHGWLSCDAPDVEYLDDCYNRCPGIAVPLDGPREITFVVQLADQDDNSPAIPDALDYSVIEAKHATEWRAYDSASSINLNHAGLDELYRTSLYHLRSNEDPKTGRVPVGAYPGMWGNGVHPYDVSYSVMAFLGANRMEEAEKILQYWKSQLPTYRRRGESVGLPGTPVVIPHWHMDKFPPTTKDKVLQERHFCTACLPIHVWEFYRYSGRVDILEEYWACIVEPLEFLIGACVNEYDDHAEIIRSSGPNGKERVNGKVVYFPNPIRSLVTVIKAVRAAIDAAKLLGKPVLPEWERLLPKLVRGVEVNRFGDIVRANKTEKASPDAGGAYLGLFDCNEAKDSALAVIDAVTSESGFITWPNSGYMVIPWNTLQASAVCSRMHVPGAAQHLETAARFATTLGAIPEAVRIDGVYSKTWYPAAHGSLAQAVNLLLVHRNGDTIELFSDVPGEWGDVEFENLRVPVGLSVTASRVEGRIIARVENRSAQSQSLCIRAHGDAPWETEVVLDPGQATNCSG